VESHIIFASAVSMRWSQYTEFLEHQYMESVRIYHAPLPIFKKAHCEKRNKALMSSVGESSQANNFHDFTVTFQDSQELQAFQEKLSRVLSAIQYNSQVMSSLQKKLKALLRQDWHPPSNLKVTALENSWFSRLDDVREETTKCQRNVAALIKRVHGIETLVSPTSSRNFLSINKLSFTESTILEAFSLRTNWQRI
jgi:hypothetical protein